VNKVKYVEYIDQELETLIPGYLEAKEERTEILRAVENEDFDKVIYLSDRLYYSSASYAFTFIEKISAEMKYWGTLHEVSALKQLLLKYKDYFENLQIIYVEN
jgi:predicted glycosyltransferase